MRKLLESYLESYARETQQLTLIIILVTVACMLKDTSHEKKKNLDT